MPGDPSVRWWLRLHAPHPPRDTRQSRLLLAQSGCHSSGHLRDRRRPLCLRPLADDDLHPAVARPPPVGRIRAALPGAVQELSGRPSRPAPRGRRDVRRAEPAPCGAFEEVIDSPWSSLRDRSPTRTRTLAGPPLLPVERWPGNHAWSGLDWLDRVEEESDAEAERDVGVSLRRSRPLGRRHGARGSPVGCT